MSKVIAFIFLCVFASCISSTVMAGELKVASYFSDEMVLQRDMPIKVWGTAENGATITVTFNGKESSAVAGDNGKWLVTLPKMPLNATGQELLVKSDKGDTKTIKNILIGDVWLCSGQSNMGYPIKVDLSGKQAKKEAQDTLLRILNVNIDFYPYPRDEFIRPANWGIAIGKHLDWKSAVTFFFGQALRRELKDEVNTANIPIGLVTSARGGTAIEAFLPYNTHKYLEEGKSNRHIKSLIPQIKAKDLSTAEGDTFFKQYLADWKLWQERSAKRIEQNKPVMPLPIFGNDARKYNAGNLFNNMIHPLKHVSFKGMIWYQGESNGSQKSEYYYMLKSYIAALREFFDQPEMPFYIVQLASFGKIDPQPGLGTGSSGVREAQRLVAMEVPYTGLAVAVDVGDPKDIHPRNKKDVAERLALWALHKDYEKKGLTYSGPLYKSHRVDGASIVVEFDHAGMGLMVGKKEAQEPVAELKGAELQEFAIAGKDLKFHPAKAVIKGSTVVVTSDKVAEPFAVRYAYSASPVGNLLYNKAGLPASPFKTDSW